MPSTTSESAKSSLPLTPALSPPRGEGERHSALDEDCIAVSRSLRRPENFLQQLRRARLWILANAFFLFGDHLEQAVAGFLHHVFVHVERGGVVVQFAEKRTDRAVVGLRQQLLVRRRHARLFGGLFHDGRHLLLNLFLAFGL